MAKKTSRKPQGLSDQEIDMKEIQLGNAMAYCQKADALKLYKGIRSHLTKGYRVTAERAFRTMKERPDMRPAYDRIMKYCFELIEKKAESSGASAESAENPEDQTKGC